MNDEKTASMPVLGKTEPPATVSKVLDVPCGDEQIKAKQDVIRRAKKTSKKGD